MECSLSYRSVWPGHGNMNVCERWFPEYLPACQGIPSDSDWCVYGPEEHWKLWMNDCITYTHLGSQENSQINIKSLNNQHQRALHCLSRLLYNGCNIKFNFLFSQTNWNESHLHYKAWHFLHNKRYFLQTIGCKVAAGRKGVSLFFFFF